MSMISTAQLCDCCHSATAQVSCKTKLGQFVFCMHHFKKQMNHRKFTAILIESTPLKEYAA